MRFSILVPVYNVKRYFNQCIESIVSQSYTDYEIVLVNDGSTDGSGELCDAAAENNNRIRVIHQPNLGLLMARRTAIKAAKGDYFIFVDSDDALAENALERIDKIITETKADLVIYHADKWDGQKLLYYRAPFTETSGVMTLDDRKDYINALLKRKISNGIWSKAVSRKIVDIDRDYSPLSIVNTGEDLLQTLPYITNAEKIYFLNENLYRYRVNPNSLTHTFSWTMYESLRCVNIELEKVSYDWLQQGLVKEREKLVAYHFITEVWEVLKRLISSNVSPLDHRVMELLKSMSDDEFLKRQWRNVDKSTLSISEKIFDYLIIGKKYRTIKICMSIFRAVYRVKKCIEMLLKTIVMKGK